MPLSAFSRVPAVVAGDHHVCALGCSSPLTGQPICEVSCWGRNDASQLGSSSPFVSAAPIRVHLPNIVGVYAASASSCALTDAGELFCWGRNDHGQIGTSMPAMPRSPERIEGLPRLSDVALGREHACALSREREVWCWGNNVEGQTGARPSPLSSPARVLGVPLATHVSVGGRHACALSIDGRVFCWGANSEGQLGDGSVSVHDSPIEVINPVAMPWTGLSCGARHTCALSGEEIFCWGDNTFGQSGPATASFVPSPSRAAEFRNTRGISAGPDRTCVYAADRGIRLMCWGRNDRGQLGGGPRSLRVGPVIVAMPE